MLGALTISAFFIRLENFKNSPNRSIDEIVYYRMGKQILAEGLTGYNTIPYAREMAATGRPLPDYFFQPVFKYPPLFSLLIAALMKIFGPSLLSASYASILAGVLMIPLTYLLGAIIYNRFVGSLAAFLMFVDPVTIICSQKIWPETTLAFFSLFSVLLFILALKKQNGIFFIYSGILCGLAAATKYPGILLVGAYGLHAVIRNQKLFARPFFWTGLVVPFLMLIPWILWNGQIYGWRWIAVQPGLHSSLLHQEELLRKTALSFLLAGMGTFWFIFRDGKARILELLAQCQRRNYLVAVFIGAAFLVLFRDNLGRALTFTALPSAGWSSGMFYYAPAHFYPGRLLEFSLFYAFAYAAFFLPVPGNDENAHLLKISLLVIMAFYIFWGNYQSRYIVACIPLLLILAAHALQRAITEILQHPHPAKRTALFAALAVFVTYTGLKTSFINLHLSFPNNLCYF